MTTGKSRWRKAPLPSENMTAVRTLIDQVAPCLAAGDPIEAHVWTDAKGRHRKVHARFADGWRATVTLHLDGTGSLSQALKLRGEIKGVMA